MSQSDETELKATENQEQDSDETAVNDGMITGDGESDPNKEKKERNGQAAGSTSDNDDTIAGADSGNKASDIAVLKAERDALYEELQRLEHRRERERYNHELEMSRMEADAARKEAQLLRDLRQDRLNTVNHGVPRNWETESTPVRTPSMPKLTKISQSINESEPNESQSVLDILELSRLQLQSHADTLRLPPTELPKFDGDPLKYYPFLKRFKSMVGKTTISSADKLDRLHEACTGKAQSAITSSLYIDDPAKGFADAMKRLQDRFGDPHRISQAWMDKVLTTEDIKSSDSLRDYADLLRGCRDTLEALNCLGELNNRRTLAEIIKKLPHDVKGRWLNENYRINNDGRLPKLDDVVDFVEREAEKRSDPVFGEIMNREPKKGDSRSKSDPKKSNRKNFSTVKSDSTGNERKSEQKTDQKKKVQCAKCFKSHYLNQCDQFRSLSVSQRTQFVMEKGLCKNCFTPGHQANNCPKSWVCNILDCGQKHNRWLHPVEAKEPPRSSTNAHTVHDDIQPADVKCGYAGSASTKVCLPILPVIVRNGSISTVTYALLDPGANSSLVSESLMSKLNLKGKTKSAMTIDTVTGTDKVLSETVDLDLKSMHCKGYKYRLRDVRTLPKLNIGLSCLASKEECARWRHLEDIPILETYEADVNLIIGQDNPELLRPEEVRVGLAKEPYATKTVLGWAINGPIGANQVENPGRHSYFVNSSQDLNKLNDSVQKFWKIDDPNALTECMSVSDRKVMEFWERSTVKEDSNYCLGIPFKEPTVNLPDNLNLAQQRLSMLGKKLNRDNELREKYTETIEKSLAKGYAEEVPQEDLDRNDGKVWYIPHHAVKHPRKKVRVVYDCSAKFRGIALNDVVYQGPDLTNKLISVLLKFRQGPIAMMADIEGMFYQVRVKPDDRDVLRFLWWKNNDPNEETQIYRMTSHLFGGIWSPSCANFALHKCASDHEEFYDTETLNTVRNNFYVDDCLKSVNSEAEAIQLSAQLISLLGKGGFRLTKWISNSQEVLASIPEAERAKGAPSLDLDAAVERALGTLWRLETDSFGFEISLSETDRLSKTKRGLLRVISSVYDPLGLAGPFVICGKMLFQMLCRRNVGWDDPIPDDLMEQWQRWLDDLPSLSKLEVPRCLKPAWEHGTFQLHHFCDASESGYGAVSYLRFVDGHNIHCSLVMSKNRLAPIKQLTVPRLELCAAVVAANLDKKIVQCLEYQLLDSVFWTDSMIVLHYLKNEEKKFQTFVANRVSQILECTSASQWKHVGTLENPADDLSRGLSASDLMHNERWLRGPPFLWQREELWPKQPELGEMPSEAETKRMPKVYTFKEEPATLDWFFERFSSFHKLKRAVALILRAKALLRKSSNVKLFDKITVSELREAEIAIIEYIQRKLIEVNIKKLSPVKIDKLLCVGGRLENAPIMQTVKHPIILPAHHHVSQLIVWHFHKITAHGGVERVLAETRQHYWIVKGRATAKRTLSTCIPCKRAKAPLSHQQMANLPSDRLIPGEPPFTRVGLDYFGPLIVKRARSDIKRYGCLFTCLTTRAIHLEVAHSLDTESFLHALERFVSRRGRPTVIRSDNGTNFVGGQRELKNLLKEWNQSQIESHLLEKEIQWIFNPPSASHMGGVWERQIRTVRTILTNLVGQQVLTDEKLATLFCVVEGIVNGRPITKLSDDPKDMKPLTPNDLLLLRPDNVLSPGNFVKQDALRQNWRQVQYLANVFWSRWLKEYLPTLQERQKWLVPQRNFKAGDLVLLMCESTPRSRWPLALIVDINAGPDGLVRSAQVKTATGTYVRPVHKLCLLEASAEE